MLLGCFSRASRVFVVAGLASVLFLLLAFLTASSLASAPNTKIVRKLNLNDRLTVRGKGCQPQVKSQANAKIVIRCVKNKAQSPEPNTPNAKITSMLNAGDKLIVKRSACRLQVTSLSNTRVWIVCDKGPLPPIVPDTTKPLSSDTTQYLESVSQDGATFTFSQATDQLNTLQVGDIIVSNPTQATPDGFLRKVVSITNNGGQVVVQTEATTIADAVQQGEISVSQILQPTNLERATFAEGVRLVKSPDAPNSFSLQLNDVVLYDEDGNANTTNDQINANGSILLDPRFDFRLKVENFQLKELYFTTTASETSQLKISSKVFVTVKAEHELLKCGIGCLAPIPLVIGPFPVTLQPVLSFAVGADGSIHAGVSTGVTQSLTETAGVSYANGAWSPIQQFTNQFTYDAPTLSAGLEIKGYTGAKLKILFYGSVGPDIALNAYLKLEANPLETPWWKLYGGLEVPVGISVEVISHVIAGWNAVVIDFSKVIAQAETPPPISSVFDDFSTYNVGSAPTGWSLFGATEITPIVEEYGGIGPAYHVLSFPEVSWQYWDKWVIRDGTIAANSYLVQAKLRFLNSVADRAGLTIAWDRNTWNHIDIDPNVYWNDIEFHSSYGGSVNNIVPNIDIQANTDYWLRAFVEDLGTNAGKVTVYWSTDGSTFTKVMEVTDLSNVRGETGVHTAGPHLPHTHFDDFEVQSQ